MEIISSDILQTLQSKVVSKEEFNFDKLAARPIISMLDYSDLDKLYNIASSIRYSGDIQKKLNAIRDIMHARGFRKFAQGTNRIVYSYFEDPSIILKIATDRVGLKDNPAEYLNQSKLKPFVTKVFEVTPDGCVGSFERVRPITSREEFLSCSDLIFGILNEITKKYIMADVGTMYFMNWGWRDSKSGSFSLPVLLDFSYLYEPDGSKLMCCAPNPNESTGICGGWIDYDEGFNELRCIKCGATYRAIDLAKFEQDNLIVRKGRKNKMRLAIKGLNGESREVSLDGTLVNNEFKPATNIMRASTSDKPVGTFKIQTPVANQQKIEQHVIKKETVEVQKEDGNVKPIDMKETIKKSEDVPVTPRKVSDVRENKSMKLKVTKDGKDTEKVIEKKKEEENKPSRAKVERPSRRNPVQLTAITFEQLKELDFKYSSTDLEFHKMFFKADHASATVSVMVDFDTIPKDKLALLAEVDLPDNTEVTTLRDELDKALTDLNAQEEAVLNLRKINELDQEKIKKLEAEIIAVKESNGSTDKAYEASINKLSLEKDTLEAELKEARKKIVDLEEQKLAALNENADLAKRIEETKEVESEVIEDEESEDDSDVQGINYINVLLMETKNLVSPEDLDDAPSQLAFVIGEDEQSELAADQNGNILVISTINHTPIDQLNINLKKKPENTENQGE